MSKISNIDHTVSSMVTFYHDIEQNIDSNANTTECRQMVKEFLKLEKKYDICATYNVVGKLFQEQPDLIEWILEQGQEVAFHSYNHQPDWKPEYYSTEIDLCRNVSSSQYGYRSPRSQWNHTTLESLWERGFLWNAENDMHKEPYYIYKGLVRLPIACDDWSLHTGTMNVDEWVRQFSELLKSRPYFAFGSHDYIASFSPLERLEAWERILQKSIENKTLLVTFSEAADLFRRASLLRCKSFTTKKMNSGAKTLYRTKRLREMVRDEAEKLNQPVIGDLSFGSSMLCSPLKSLAKKIYCIDNAPNIIAEVDSASCINGRLGEVADSGLPDNLFDLVICSHIIEYMFWPDLLANEIKRIGKVGATYFITFPALQEAPLSREGAPPDRIRRYFTPYEIEKWANQIGPGHIKGIQYERAEPIDIETEEQYRITEKTPPRKSCPTIWVYIGTIQNKLISHRNKETIPVLAFNFSFPSPRYDQLKMYLTNIGRRFLKPIHQMGK